jgi:hypothetical protein
MTRFALAIAGSVPLRESNPLAMAAGWCARLLRTRRWRKSHPRPERLPDYILRDIGLSRLEFEFGTGGRIRDINDSALFRDERDEPPGRLAPAPIHNRISATARTQSASRQQSRKGT